MIESSEVLLRRPHYRVNKSETKRGKLFEKNSVFSERLAVSNVNAEETETSANRSKHERPQLEKRDHQQSGVELMASHTYDELLWQCQRTTHIHMTSLRTHHGN